MIWPRRLFGRAHPPAAAGDPADQSAANPVLLLLDAAGVPWRLPRAALASRYGIRRHPVYGGDIIEVATAEPILDGLLWPLSAMVLPQFSPAMPAAEFSSIVFAGDDAGDNLRLALAQLEPKLGPARVGGSDNTIARQWAFGATRLRLTVWPPDRQPRPLVNPANQRDPRLRTGCRVAIKTGFRPPASAEELIWFDGFVPVAPLQLPPHIDAHSIYDTPAEESELEFVRRPIARLDHIFGRIGCSADGAALIFCHAQLYLVPLTAVIGFKVERLQPGKGPGGSRLLVESRTDFRAVGGKRLLISAATGADELNELAAGIANTTAKRLVFEDCGYDT